MVTESSNSIMNWLKDAGLKLLGGIAVLVIGFLLVHWIGNILKHNKKFHAIEPTLRGFLQNLVGFICIMAANGIVRRLDADSSLF